MGYPDFQAYPSWRGGELLGGPSLTIPAAGQTFPASGAFLTDSYAGVLLRVIPGGGHGTVTLSWWLDAAATLVAGSDTWTVNPSCGLVARVPGRAPYCTLTISPADGVAMTCQATMLPDNGGRGAPQYPVTGNSVFTGNITYTPSQTVLYQLPFVQAGLAAVSAAPGDALGKLQFDVVTFTPTGTLNNYLARLGLLTADTTELVGLTDDMCGLQVVNTDAGASHSARFSLAAGLAKAV